MGNFNWVVLPLKLRTAEKIKYIAKIFIATAQDALLHFFHAPVYKQSNNTIRDKMYLL